MSQTAFFRTSRETCQPPKNATYLVLKKIEFLPWDNQDSIVSAEVDDLTRRLKDTILKPILFLIGGPANVINMAVFDKQGPKERVNLCLFACRWLTNSI